MAKQKIKNNLEGTPLISAERLYSSASYEILPSREYKLKEGGNVYVVERDFRTSTFGIPFLAGYTFRECSDGMYSGFKSIDSEEQLHFRVEKILFSLSSFISNFRKL